MPRFLNTAKARGEIESILASARENIFMISPYIKFSEDLISRLKDAGGRRKVKILLVCREEDLREDVRKRVEQVPNLEIHIVAPWQGQVSSREAMQAFKEIGEALLPQ